MFKRMPLFLAKFASNRANLEPIDDVQLLVRGELLYLTISTAIAAGDDELSHLLLVFWRWRGRARRALLREGRQATLQGRR